TDPITGDFLFSTFGADNHVIAMRGFAAPVSDNGTPTATSTVTSPTSTPTATETPTATPTPTPTNTAIPTPTPTNTATASPTATATPTATPEPATPGTAYAGNLRFITPVRIVDTRAEAGGPIGVDADGTPITAGKLQANQSRRFKVNGQTFNLGL